MAREKTAKTTRIGTHHVETWYNPKARSWVTAHRDEGMNQIGECFYSGYACGARADHAIMVDEVEHLLGAEEFCKAHGLAVKG